MAEDLNLNEGERLYKYQLISRIGSGGFANVWLAHDGSIGKDIAVKVLNSDDASVNVARNRYAKYE